MFEDGDIFVLYRLKADGNLLNETGGYRSAEYRYNGQNRMAYSEVTDHAKGTVAASEYVYDAFGRRTITQDTGRTAMRTLYDGFTFEVIRDSETFQYGGFTVRGSPGIVTPSSPVQGVDDSSRFRLVTEGYSTWLPDGVPAPQGRSGGETATPERKYVGISATLWANGEPVAINRYDTATFTGGTVYLGKDALGSVRGATNDYGLLEERYEYDAFEKPYKGDLNSGMNLGYTGKPYDTATGMYNYGYRDYQPEVARFTTVDPIRDGANWFAYVNNDPVNWVDLWGLEIIYLKGPGATDADTEATKQMEENVKNSGTLAGQLVQKLADSDKTVRVEVNTERINEAWPGNDGNMTWDEAVKSADGTGGDVYIRFDPTDNTPLDDGTKGYAEATYVHEVAGHGYPMATGTNPPDQKTREVDATAIENQYRASQGWEQRKTYGSWDVPQYENQPVTLARNRHKGKR